MDRKLQPDLFSHLCVKLVSRACLHANVYYLKPGMFIGGSARLLCVAIALRIRELNTRWRRWRVLGV